MGGCGDTNTTPAAMKVSGGAMLWAIASSKCTNCGVASGP
jgi:hypothetical protein